MSDLLTDTGADFSPCRTWRYRLWRTWDAGRPPLVMLMLNPSTADEDNNDPTVERCERRARRIGAGGLVVLNIFAFRATVPDVMKAVDDPVGPGNDAAILNELAAVAAARTAGRPTATICAGWGIHGAHRGRDREVSAMFVEAGVPLYCLGVTANGQPRHPLYIANAAEFQPWSAP